MKELAYERAFREWVHEHGMRWGRLRYARPEAGGQTLAYRISPEAPYGRLLVVHGAGNDALFSLVGLLKDVLRQGLEVFTFDMDGHGRGSTTEFAPTTAPGTVEAALGHALHGGEHLPTHAVGISLGGALLLHALPGLSDRLASAVLLAAPLQVRVSRRAVLRELRPSLLATLWRERAHYRPWELIPSFGPFKRGVYPLRIAAEHAGEATMGGFGYVQVLNAALREMRLEDAARRVRTPTLLVYGTADRIVPIEQGERLAERIPGAELRRIDGGTHLTTPFAPAATRNVLSWLHDHAPQRAS